MSTVLTHAVVATKIVKLSPLLGRGGVTVLAPDQGLELLLEDGRKIKWLAEDYMPAVDDFLIEDKILGTTYAVPAAKFAELFSV